MDFFRHCYGADFRSNPESNDVITNFLTDLSNFGFVSTETNEGIYKSFYKENLTDMHWKNDLLHQARIRKESLERHRLGELQFCLSNESYSETASLSEWRYSYGNTSSAYSYYHSHIIRHSDEDNTDPIRNSVIMIPLINGGFIYNLAACHQIAIIKPTPKLIIRGNLNDYSIDKGPAYNQTLTIIGIPPTIKSSINNYIYFGIYCYCQSNNYITPKYLTDYQHGRVLDYIPYITTNVPLVENTCVLTKMPHDNGYLDNVYTMTTRPGPLTVRGSIFSFAGRNFINVIDNLVLELPS